MAKRERPTITSKLKTEAQKQESLAKQLISNKSNATKTTTRTTIDFPTELHQQMKEKAKENGQTVKGYILKLIRDDLQ